jgi:hypothetical protein
MAQKTQQTRIGDLDVAVTQFRPTAAYHVIAFALKTLGPVLGAVVPALAGGGVGALLSMNASTLGAAFAQLDVQAAEALLLELLKRTEVVTERDGRRVKYDLSRGREELDGAFDEAGIGAMFAVAKFAVEVNFAGFTKSAAALGAGAAPGVATPST